MMKCKGFIRKLSWPTCKVLFRRLLGEIEENDEKVTVRIIGLRVEILTRDLQNMK
jgi:hypothetical protein